MAQTTRGGAAIEPEVDLSGYWIDGDVVRIGGIRIGADASIGARSTLAPGTKIGRRAEIAPGSAVVLWVVLLGTPQMLFPAALVLMQLRARTHEGTVALSGFAQSVGYAVAAIFPIAFALLREATGEWTAPILMIGVLMIATIPAGTVASRPSTVEDEWERHHGPWR